jgi:hypothetical protein
MAELQRRATSTSVIDVLDHILDKGIVIDAWIRVSVVGIDLLTMDARVVVASIETYLTRADEISQALPALTTLSQRPILQHVPTISRGKRGRVPANLRTPKH